MSNKAVKDFRRRYSRLMSRMDADDEEGRWITTENGHKVHINAEGEPDMGNEHVIAAMKGESQKSGGSSKHQAASSSGSSAAGRNTSASVSKLNDIKDEFGGWSGSKDDFIEAFEEEGFEIIDDMGNQVVLSDSNNPHDTQFVVDFGNVNGSTVTMNDVRVEKMPDSDDDYDPTSVSGSSDEYADYFAEQHAKTEDFGDELRTVVAKVANSDNPGWNQEMIESYAIAFHNLGDDELKSLAEKVKADYENADNDIVKQARQNELDLLNAEMKDRGVGGETGNKIVPEMKSVNSFWSGKAITIDSIKEDARIKANGGQATRNEVVSDAMELAFENPEHFYDICNALNDKELVDQFKWEMGPNNTNAFKEQIEPAINKVKDELKAQIPSPSKNKSTSAVIDGQKFTFSNVKNAMYPQNSNQQRFIDVRIEDANTGERIGSYAENDYDSAMEHVYRTVGLTTKTWV